MPLEISTEIYIIFYVNCQCLPSPYDFITKLMRHLHVPLCKYFPDLGDVRGEEGRNSTKLINYLSEISTVEGTYTIKIVPPWLSSAELK